MTYVPPPPPETLRPLDLAQRKDVGALITSAWRIWKARPAVFILTAMTVAFVPLVAYRIAMALVVNDVLKDFTDTLNQNAADNSTDPFLGFDWNSLVGPAIVVFVGGIIVSLLVPALVTATHARAVTALATGDDLTGSEALKRGLAVLGPAVWAIFVYGVLTFLGFLLIIPGVYLSVGGMFVTVIVALSLGRGYGALRESLRVVRAAGWWRTLGNAIVIYIVAYAIAFVPLAVIGAITGSPDASDGMKIVGAIIEGFIQAALLSWSALALTLLFFSTKARIGEPWLAGGTLPVEIPGGGGPPMPPPAYPVTGPYYGSTPTPGGPTFVRPGQAPPPQAPWGAPGQQPPPPQAPWGAPGQQPPPPQGPWGAPGQQPPPPPPPQAPEAPAPPRFIPPGGSPPPPDDEAPR